MNIRIAEISLLALCLAGFAACSSQKEPPPDIRGTSGAAKEPGGTGAIGETDGAGATAGSTDSSATGAATTGSGDSSSTIPATSTTGTRAATEVEPMPDPDSPTVRVFQVDGTDSVEVSVDARHMKQNLLFDDAHCKVLFEVGSDADKMNAETNFPLGSFTVKETPTNKVFRHRLGTDAIATSYAFTATESIIGTGQRRSAMKRSTVIFKRPMGVNTRLMILSNPRLKFATVIPPIKTAKVIAPASSVTTKTTVLPAKVTTTRMPVTVDTAKKPTRAGSIIAPRIIQDKALRPRVR
jgi:hypothetical protein